MKKKPFRFKNILWRIRRKDWGEGIQNPAPLPPKDDENAQNLENKLHFCQFSHLLPSAPLPFLSPIYALANAEYK